MMQDLAKLATSENEHGQKISNKELKLIIKDIFKSEQRPEKNISLDFEHSLSIAALKNLQLSLKSFYKIVIKVAKNSIQINIMKFIHKFLDYIHG